MYQRRSVTCLWIYRNFVAVQTLNWARKCNYHDGCFKVCKPRKYKYGGSIFALMNPLGDRAQNIWMSFCIDQFGLRVPHRVAWWNSFTSIELRPTSEHNDCKAAHLQDHAAESSVRFHLSMYGRAAKVHGLWHNDSPSYLSYFLCPMPLNASLTLSCIKGL